MEVGEGRGRGEDLELGSLSPGLEGGGNAGRTEEVLSTSSGAAGTSLADSLTAALSAGRGPRERGGRGEDASTGGPSPSGRTLLDGLYHMLGRGEGGRQNQRRSSGGQEDPLELAVHRASSTSVSSDSPRATPTAGAGNSTFDYNVVLLWLEQALPFLLILFCFFLREHLMEIGFFGLHTFLFLKGNQIIRSTIAHRGANSNSSKKLVLVTSLLSASSVLLLLVVFPQQKLWKSMVLIPPPHRLNVWHSLFRCALCDVTLRQAGVVVKASQLLVWRPAAGSQFRRQGHLLTFVEHATILYGLLLPVPIWYSFFQTETFGQIFSSVSTGFYLTMKISTLFEKVLNFVVALRILIQPVCDHYGTRATKEEVCELGDACCSICQDEMASPLKLRCNHIFCAECIGEWLDRDTTCPLCRTVVKSDVVRSFSDGSSGWILQLF